VEWKSTGPTTQLAQTGIYVHELPNDGCEDTPPQVKKLEVSVVSLETSPQCQYQEWQAAADPSEIAGSAGSDQVAQQPIFVQLETGQLSAIHSQE
jgi:hypothetical protein